MAEKYVSVSELRKLLGIPSNGQCTGCQFVTLHGCKDDSIQRACEGIDDAPEADVRPVAEGHWLTWEEMFPDQNPRRKNNLGVFCSACKKHADNMTDFCPNCGADMRKVVEIDQVKEDAE